MKEKISGIYKIQSIIKPERVYIGSATIIFRRWYYHLARLRTGKHENSKLQRHYDKYGESDLQFSILLGCPKEDLIKTEQFFLDSYNPYFNICKFAHSTLGRPSWSKGMRGVFHRTKGCFKKGNIPWQKGKPAWNRGKKYEIGSMKQETKDKISKSMMGKKNALKK